MNFLQKIIYKLLAAKEKSLKIRLDKHLKRSATNATSKTVMSGTATLTLSTETQKNAELVRENVSAIVKKTGGNPLDEAAPCALDVEYQHVVHPPLRHEAGGFLPRAEWGRTKL